MTGASRTIKALAMLCDDEVQVRHRPTSGKDTAWSVYVGDVYVAAGPTMGKALVAAYESKIAKLLRNSGDT